MTEKAEGLSPENRALAPAGGWIGKPKCPACDKALKWVGPGPGYMNSDQWDALKAGEYFTDPCSQAGCPGRDLNGYRYFGEIASPAARREGPTQPRPGEIREINSKLCRFVEADDKGDVWEVLPTQPPVARAGGGELLSCPFCGGAMMERHALWVSDGCTDAIIHAEPSNCGMDQFDIGATDNGASTRAAWNRRTPSPDTDGKGEAEALRARLKAAEEARSVQPSIFGGDAA